ncbi:MAG: Methyltransferase type 11 [Rhodospirillales bacterium]|nr:Methyltransferase type 11 [Rhodospirillales bacterium]
MTNGAGNNDYVLAARGREAHEIGRLELLQQIFDPFTRRRLDIVQLGWRCLEVGAGRGSIARFLSDRVGPTGAVIATDIDIEPLVGLDLPNGKVVKHNILVDSLAGLGGPGSFDLIHGRLLLQHLFDHQDLAIMQMVALLKPGGWLVIEDLDTDTISAADPAHLLSERYNQGIAAGVAAMRASRSVDPACGRGLLPRFKRAGLGALRHEGFVLLEQGGGPLCRWYAQSTEGSRRPGGDPSREAAIALTLKALNDPNFWLQSGLFHCAWGQNDKSRALSSNHIKLS